jgi:hypothetical protein
MGGLVMKNGPVSRQVVSKYTLGKLKQSQQIGTEADAITDMKETGSIWVYPGDFSMETAQINLAVFRSIYHSAAIVALSRKFGDFWKSTIESKTVIRKMGTTPMVDSLGRPLY